MTKLVFGNYPADMLDTENLGFSQFFPSLDLDLVSASTESIVTRDPLSGATMEFRGVFDLSSDAALLASVVNATLWKTAAGEGLLDWTEFSIRVAEFLGLGLIDPDEINAYLLRGDDSITGGVGNDVLRGHGGNDLLDGGGGTDRAAYVTMSSAFRVARSGANFVALLNFEWVAGFHDVDF